MKTRLTFSVCWLLAPAVLPLLSACQRQVFSGPTPPAVAAVSLEPRTLRFGHGSAYTGFRTTYTLQADGALLTHAGLGMQPRTTCAAPETGRISGGQTRALFRRLDALPTDSLQFDHPGQHYYFVEGYTSGGQVVRLAWGAPGSPAPHCARVLYRQLLELVPAS